MANTGSFSGIALWLAPPLNSASSTQLSSVLSSLSTTYSTLSFEPHVTLLTGIPSDADVDAVLQTAGEALSSLNDGSQFHLRYTGLGTNHTFFQYLFATVEPTPELLELRRRTRNAFHRHLEGTPDDYFPHLSLLYGTDDPKTGREADKILEDLKTQGVVELLGDKGFTATSVMAVKCEGPPDTWEILGDISVDAGVPVDVDGNFL